MVDEEWLLLCKTGTNLVGDSYSGGMTAFTL